MPRLAHHDLLRLGGRVALNRSLTRRSVSRGGAVADADELDLVLLAQLAQVLRLWSTWRLGSNG